MSKVVAIGPASQQHGEAKMFNYSCDRIKQKYELIIIDSAFTKCRILRPFYVIFRLSLTRFFKDVSHIYLSYSRNKLMLILLLPVLFIVRTLTKVKCIYHIHDTSLKQNTSGVLGGIIKYFYVRCIDVTIIPNEFLESYTRISSKADIKFLLNPYLGELKFKDSIRVEKFHFVSYPSHFKNLDRAIKIANQAGVFLEIIGWSKADFNRIYPDASINLTKIEFLGQLSHEKVVERLSTSSGLISISNHESMPLNIIEALLLSVPVYVNESSGYLYFLQNFDTVNVLTNSDSLKIKNSIQELEKSRSKARKIFDKEKYDNGLFEVFSNLSRVTF